MSKRRKFTKEEKLRIAHEAAANGVKLTLEKHGVYPATYYAWKKKVEQMGEAGLAHEVLRIALRPGRPQVSDYLVETRFCRWRPADGFNHLE